MDLRATPGSLSGNTEDTGKNVNLCNCMKYIKLNTEGAFVDIFQSQASF